MSARNNLLKPADGLPTLSIYQDIVLGSYYMTYAKPSEQVENPRVFASVEEAVLARDKGLIKPQTNIKIRYKGELRDTTLGRVKLNEALPEDFPFVNEVMTRKALNRVLARIFNRYGSDVTADTANAIKDLTLKNATRSAVSTGMTDYFDIDDLEIDLKEADDKVTATTNAFKDGLITDRERHTAIRTAWVNARNNISDKFTQKLVDTDTGISISVQSGARGSISNVVDVSGIVGVINATYNVSAKRNLDELKMAAEIELPVRSNYKKGLTPLELTVAARGSRKGLIDTALNTAKSGYLTRRLVDAAQDVFTVDGNEDTVDPGFAIYREDSEYTRVTFEDRLIGRYAAEDVKGHIKAGELITQDVAAAIQNDEAIASVKIMSPLSTLDVDGIPRKAYGIDLATGVLVEAHEPIGVIAAQSVGEPATQLTLNNKHGAGEEDVTEGLPRLEELLELYGADVKDGKLKVSASFYENKYALLSSIDGKVKVKEDKKTGKKTVTVEGIRSENGENKDAIETFTTSNRLAVKNGDKVARGSRITEGSIYPPYLMEIMGEHAAKRYILNDILRLYAGQGYALSSKHIEVIISQMFSRVEVVDPGDSDLSEGALVSRSTAKDANDKLAAEGKKLAEFKTVVQGIKRVSATSDSFLSAASFQDTTRVLIAAATSGKVDRLKGLKENVIIGRKIPVGTGAIAGIGLSNAPSEDEFTNL
jgi:DNA-directed RNA polymerase subunit beta'